MAILLISPEPWHAHNVSKHHYARVLAGRGQRVLFLEPPSEDLHDLEIRSAREGPSLEILCGPRVAPGLRFLPGKLRCWLEKSWLYELERRIDDRIKIIWLFENSRFYDLRFAGNRLRIYHQVDLNQRFHPDTAARTADICFCTTDLIREQLLPHNERVHVLHHALQQPSRALPLTAEQRSYFQRPGPHLVYVGNLGMDYLDVELLTSVAREHNDATLHLVGGGPVKAPLRRALAEQKNVVWWGKQPSAALPTILEQADILLITYQERHWYDQASPHKLMDYLGSGKVVVASYTHQYRYQRHLLAMADLGSDYLALLRGVRRELAVWNAPERQEERRSFALKHTYDHQLDRIEEHLQAHGLPSLLTP